MKIQSLLVLTMVLVLGLSSVVYGQAISFEDPNLETSVRRAIGKVSGDIFATDAAYLITLNAASRNIQSLEGIEQLTNLTGLVIRSRISAPWPG